jgi:hypothetical protein
MGLMAQITLETMEWFLSRSIRLRQDSPSRCFAPEVITAMLHWPASVAVAERKLVLLRRVPRDLGLEPGDEKHLCRREESEK